MEDTHWKAEAGPKEQEIATLAVSRHPALARAVLVDVKSATQKIYNAYQNVAGSRNLLENTWSDTDYHADQSRRRGMILDLLFGVEEYLEFIVALPNLKGQVFIGRYANVNIGELTKKLGLVPTTTRDEVIAASSLTGPYLNFGALLDEQWQWQNKMDEILSVAVAVATSFRGYKEKIFPQPYKGGYGIH